MTKTKVTTEEAAERAKEIVEQALAGDGGGDGTSPPEEANPKKKPVTKKAVEKKKAAERKPAWVRYYESNAEDPNSPFGKGIAQVYDYFESDLMKNYVQDNDSLFDLVGQHPEACALLYPDTHGNIQILHHLTAATHGRAIVVGVDGFGSTSEVRAANLSSFTEKIEFQFLDGGRKVPQETDFMEQEFGKLVATSSEENDPTLQEFFEGCPIGYMIHPLWVSLIYDQVGNKPEEVGETLVSRLTEYVNENRKGFDEYESLADYFREVHFLLVYLWACHNRYFVMGKKGSSKRLTRTFDTKEFQAIQDSIIRKVLQSSATKDQPTKNFRITKRSRNLLL